MSQTLADSLRRSLLNTPYNQARRDPRKLEYIEKFKLQYCDENLLWIVDNLISPTAPQDSSRATFEQFYQTLLVNLQRASRGMQYNSLEFIFTQRPPVVVRDIISMCAYLQIDLQSEFVWLAMTALSLGTPPGWILRDGEYVNAKTGVTLQTHPADTILQQWKGRKIAQTGTYTIIRLAHDEYAKIGSSFIVLYDFKQLKTKFIGKHDLFKPDLICIQLTDEEIINQQLYEHIELAGALIEANEVVFQGAHGDVVLPQEHLIDDDVDTVMYTYNILQQQNKSKTSSKFVKKHGYERQRKYDCQYNHYLMRFYQSLLPDVQLTREYVKEKLLPPPAELAYFIGYACVSYRHYKLIVYNQAPVAAQYVSPVHSAGYNVQLRLIVNISYKPVDGNAFSLNSTLSLGNVFIFNDLNGFPYPYESKGGLEPTIYDFMIGKSVSCRGVVFVIKQISLETRKWLKQCGSVFSKLGRHLGYADDLGDDVAAGQVNVMDAIDRFIKLFYYARANGQETYATELVDLIKATDRASLALTM